MIPLAIFFILYLLLGHIMYNTIKSFDVRESKVKAYIFCLAIGGIAFFTMCGERLINYIKTRN